MESLLVENEWIGQFFLPDQFENRFLGRVSFSPEDGVKLSFCILGNDLPPSSDILHGVLTTGEKCTLVGPFSPTYAGYAVNNGLITRSGTNVFFFFVLGEFVDKDEMFKEITFSVTGMQEFFFPRGFKDLVKYSNKPLFRLKTAYGEIEVGNNAKFGILGKDITSQIYNRNEDALLELKKAFEEIDQRYSNSFFLLKKDIAYMITLRTSTESTIQELYKRIEEISNLFAILTYSPVFPETIEIKHFKNSEHIVMSKVYPTRILEEKTIKLSKRERSHFHMPITASKIDLVPIVESWLSLSKRFSTIVTSLQHETGLRNEHSLYGEIVLYATHFEYISLSDGVTNHEKYKYPVNKYGTVQIESGLSKVFQTVGEDNFGKGISILRNEIAHIGRPPRLLLELSLSDMCYISQFLQVTILGYVLYTLGVNKEIIHEYQNRITPK